MDSSVEYSGLHSSVKLPWHAKKCTSVSDPKVLNFHLTIIQLKVSDCSCTSTTYSIIIKKKLYDFIEVSQIIQRLLWGRQNTPKTLAFSIKAVLYESFTFCWYHMQLQKQNLCGWSNVVFFFNDSFSKILRLLKLYWIKHYTLECQSLQLVWAQGLFLTQCRYPHLTEPRRAFFGCIYSGKHCW